MTTDDPIRGELLLVADRFKRTPQLGLDIETQGRIAGYMKRADVRGPGGPNALPAMMQMQACADAGGEVASFSDVDRVPVSVRGLLTEDVNARTWVVSGPNGVQLKLVRTL